MNKEPLKWKTKDDRTLQLSEMTKEHLQNAAAMLRRHGFCSEAEAELAWSAFSMCHGDMATYYAEQACDDLCPTRVLDELDAEIGRRT